MVAPENVWLKTPNLGPAGGVVGVGIGGSGSKVGGAMEIIESLGQDLG